MISYAHRMAGIVISQRHSIECDNLPWFSIQLYVGIAVRRGIHNPPKLPFTRRDVDGWTKVAIDREYAFGRLRVSAAGNLCFYFLHRCQPIGILLNRWSAEDEYPFRQAADHGGIAFHSFNNYCTRHSVHNLLLTLAMWMRVIPVQTRFLVQWNMNHVVQGL